MQLQKSLTNITNLLVSTQPICVVLETGLHASNTFLGSLFTRHIVFSSIVKMGRIKSGKGVRKVVKKITNKESLRIVNVQHSDSKFLTILADSSLFYNKHPLFLIYTQTFKTFETFPSISRLQVHSYDLFL